MEWKLTLFCCNFPFVVCVMAPAKEKAKLGVPLLFGHRHLLELGTISSHEVGQFVNDVPRFLV